jgi:hypothetical protein
MERENLRTPHASPPSVRHLSLYLTESDTVLGKVFLQETPLSERIRTLELNVKIQSLVQAPA